MVTAWVDNEEEFAILLQSLLEGGYKINTKGPQEPGEFYLRIERRNGGWFAKFEWEEKQRPGNGGLKHH